MITDSELRIKYVAALRRCQQNSIDKNCTFHVNAKIVYQREMGVPKIVDFAISDWTDESTVASYTNGFEH